MPDLNRDGDKICQEQHWQMQLCCAQLQSKMYEQAQDCTDACIRNERGFDTKYLEAVGMKHINHAYIQNGKQRCLTRQ